MKMHQKDQKNQFQNLPKQRTLKKGFIFYSPKQIFKHNPPLSNSFFHSLALIEPNESYRQSGWSKENNYRQSGWSKENNYRHSGRPKNNHPSNYMTSLRLPWKLISSAMQVR